MFKKKPDLPPRPTLPTTEDIISDLISAANDNSLLETAKMISEKKLRPENSLEEDAIYQKINKLFKMHDELQKNMMNLDALRNKLEQKEKDMVALSNDLKNKALKALL